MANVGKFVNPKRDYSQTEEVQFRRDLEAQLADILAEIRAIRTGSSPEGSLVSKREGMLSVPVGIREYS